MAKIGPGVGPKYPQVVVLVGATGDLSQRKLLPGLFHLISAGFIPGCRIIGVSLDEIDVDGFREIAREAIERSPGRKASDADWCAFAQTSRLCADGRRRQRARDRGGEGASGPGRGEPPRCIISACRPPPLCRRCGCWRRPASSSARASSWKSRSAPISRAPRSLNAKLHEVFTEDQIFRIDHFLGKEPAQNILAFRFANGLFEPIWNRNFIDHVQIDVPETLGLGKRAAFYEQTGAYRDMVVTHLFQILAFMAMEPPTALCAGADQRGEEQGLPQHAADRPEGRRARAICGLPRRRRASIPESDTETFIALKCSIDNWRWAGVPFFLRTGKRMAEGQRIISIAFREPPKSMFPVGSGVGAQGPDHLTFDLADASKVSLSFYGKRPGPGMRLDKLSLQFAMHDTGLIGDVLEAYERLILDAMRGDHTLFTTAEGIERLWEVSIPLLEAPPPVRLYAPDSWGPKSIHQLVAPHAWRLPFERAWRNPNRAGA